MDETQRLAYLAAMDIPVWLARDRMPVGIETTATPAQRITPANKSVHSPIMPNIPSQPVTPQPGTISPTATPAQSLDNVDWDALATKVAQCQLCAELVANRSRTVFGVGNRQASLLVVGEAPGADEDAQGEPFVGRAGQLLNAMLNAIGLKREEVYIANILKCRPPNNRDPQPEEALSCQPFLLRQIDLLAPKLMLAVGRIATQNLLNTQIPIGKLRKKIHEYGHKRIPMVVTYHPAYLLRSPGQKAEAWKDLQAVMRMLQQT